MPVFRRLLLILMPMLAAGPLPAQPQESSISGFVVDATNGESLIGANVFLQGTARGGSTNMHGYFVIPRLAAGTYIVVCRYIGYAPARLVIPLKGGEQRQIKFSLQPQTLQGSEIIVRGEPIRPADALYEKPLSKIELGAREIQQIPQIAEADLLRSLQTLPGILPVSDFSSALYIRGGTPDQNLYLLDGTDVYNPEHAFGLFSTFNTDAIKNVELSKGGFGAAYGDRLSSIIEITNLDGNRKEFEGRGAISMLSARTTLQMPLGRVGSVSASFRRTYFDQTVAKFVDEIPDYYFYDGNLKAFFELNPRNRLTVSIYGGRDVLHFVFNKKADDPAGLDYAWGNTTSSVQWARVFSPQLFGNFWATGSRFSSNFNFASASEFSEKNFISDFTAKGNLIYYFSQSTALQFGFEQKLLHGIFQQKFPGGRVDVDKTRQLSVAYVQANWQPRPRWNIEAGARFTYFRSDLKFQDLAPRLSAKRRMSDTWSLKMATGVYYQYLHRIPRPFFADIWTTSDRFSPPSKAVHYIAGLQKEVAGTYSLEIDAYYKSYENLHSFKRFITDISADSFDPDGGAVYTEAKGLFERADGHSAGFELLLKKDSGPVTGWLGYSFARTRYRIADLNQGRPFSPRHDRTSTINLVINVALKNALRQLRGRPAAGPGAWQIGVNFVYSTGQPITVPASAYKIGTFPDLDGIITFPDVGFSPFALFPSGINGYRLPAYIRLDLSFTYEKRYRGWSMLPYLQIFNIGNRKNVWFIQYADDSTAEEIVQRVKPINMFPLLPTLGVNFKF